MTCYPLACVCVCLCVSYLDLIASNFSSLPAWQPARIIGCHHELTALFTLVVTAVCYQLYQIHSLCVCSCMLKVPVLVVSSIIMAKKEEEEKRSRPETFSRTQSVLKIYCIKYMLCFVHVCRTQAACHWTNRTMVSEGEAVFGHICHEEWGPELVMHASFSWFQRFCIMCSIV